MAKTPEPDDKSATETVTVSKTQLDALLARLDKLETQAQAEIEISTELPQAVGLKPGQYVNIAPANESPDLRKVRWTRSNIESTYTAVEFIPIIDIVVAPHGIPWSLQASTPVTVPSIVRDLHDSEVYRRRHQYDRYRPESPMEILESIQRSKETPGHQVWGRVHLVGHGLAMGAEQAEPATETKA